MTQIAYALAFLLFDREAGRVRPSVLIGLAAAALAVGSHVWLSGPWLKQAGIPAAARPSRAAITSSMPSASCGEGARRP